MTKEILYTALELEQSLREFERLKQLLSGENPNAVMVAKEFEHFIFRGQSEIYKQFCDYVLCYVCEKIEDINSKIDGL